MPIITRSMAQVQESPPLTLEHLFLAIEKMKEDLPSRKDLESLRSELRTDNNTLQENLKSEIKTDIDNLKTDLNNIKSEIQTNNEQLKADLTKNVKDELQTVFSQMFENRLTQSLGDLNTRVTDITDSLDNVKSSYEQHIHEYSQGKLNTIQKECEDFKKATNDSFESINLRITATENRVNFLERDRELTELTRDTEDISNLENRITGLIDKRFNERVEAIHSPCSQNTVSDSTQQQLNQLKEDLEFTQRKLDQKLSSNLVVVPSESFFEDVIIGSGGGLNKQFPKFKPDGNVQPTNLFKAFSRILPCKDVNRQTIDFAITNRQDETADCRSTSTSMFIFSSRQQTIDTRRCIQAYIKFNLPFSNILRDFQKENSRNSWRTQKIYDTQNFFAIFHRWKFKSNDLFGSRLANKAKHSLERSSL